MSRKEWQELAEETAELGGYEGEESEDARRSLRSSLLSLLRWKMRTGRRFL